MKQFVKINNMWKEYDGKTSISNAKVRNYNGKLEINLNLKEKEMLIAEKWEDLNWEDTEIFDKSYKTGWLSREGIFYGCKSQLHWMQAILVHKKTDFDLEKEGFIKITLSELEYKRTKAIFPAKFLNKKLSPTIAQIEYLENQMGIDYKEVFDYFQEKIEEDECIL